MLPCLKLFAFESLLAHITCMHACIYYYYYYNYYCSKTRIIKKKGITTFTYTTTYFFFLKKIKKNIRQTIERKRVILFCSVSYKFSKLKQIIYIYGGETMRNHRAIIIIIICTYRLFFAVQTTDRVLHFLFFKKEIVSK